MYGMKPIINQLVSQLHTEYENGLMKAVQSCGFDVDKERLSQALHNAERFYVEGYHDAMTNHDVVKVVRCAKCRRRYDADECPMCVLIDGEYHEYTTDDGFCDRGERRDTDA